MLLSCDLQPVDTVADRRWRADAGCEGPPRMQLPRPAFAVAAVNGKTVVVGRERGVEQRRLLIRQKQRRLDLQVLDCIAVVAEDLRRYRQTDLAECSGGKDG